MNRKTPRRSDRSSGVFKKRVVCSRLWGKKSGCSILSEFKKIVVYNGRIPISTANSMQRIEKIHT
ncbi:unknown [Clostridium sp. CAG:81]|nr:unknown [Clostridium sp. CAG:81]